ncbi:41 kDa peptidyl-prolyl cis-trans isomerase [Hondaea fermentalgiana]|uniref:peptidylprolyl isomerase n=1 Tax=Hondaea fermentalgiana TaxID=2315210 RepID=A0A2R5GEG2_9STRA|nr:41 kDa peptidyl-prolyl cis-trans isomerase [Hondaea fermentalgiana]|eukprot:GBG28945.1 41 kDa peptidyl-prolyl cis-trans isomerase [Hondaea fermentalgiana]
MTEAEKIAGADSEDVAKDESMPPTSESTVGVSEDVEDVEDELSVSSESSEDRDVENWPAQERLARAESCKASGNEFFKKKENEEAVKLYAKGLKVLEKLWKLDAEVLDEDVRVQLTTLTVSLRLNSAVAQSREEKWKEARSLASKAMDAIRSAHAAPVAEAEAKKHLVKALFRRGVAYARMGDLDEAKADLVSLLKMDRTNKEAVREYNAVKQKLEKARADQQQQFAAAFQKASQSGGVYGDKEAERKRAALRKIEEERKRRDAWKKATEADGSQVPFEEWCKAEDKRIEEDRKAKEAAEKAQREKEAEERRQRAREAREKREAEGDSDVELDEEDRKILEETRKKGYCYFRTQRSAEDERLLQQNQGPARLNSSTGESASPSPSTASADAVKRSTSSTSAWNANGTTWEERDVSKAAQQGLEEALGTVRVETVVDGRKAVAFVDKVSKVDGDAQIILARGKPAGVYDMSASLSWKATCEVGPDGAEVTEARGTLKMPDIANGVDARNYDVSCTTKRVFEEPNKASLDPLLRLLRREVCKVTATFVENLPDRV